MSDRFAATVDEGRVEQGLWTAQLLGADFCNECAVRWARACRGAFSVSFTIKVTPNVC